MILYHEYNIIRCPYYKFEIDTAKEKKNFNTSV